MVLFFLRESWIISPWEREWPLILTNLYLIHPMMLYAMFGWFKVFFLSGYWEEVKNVKKLLTDRHTDAGHKVIRKAHLNFKLSSGELKPPILQTINSWKKASDPACLLKKKIVPQSSPNLVKCLDPRTFFSTSIAFLHYRGKETLGFNISRVKYTPGYNASEGVRTGRTKSLRFANYRCILTNLIIYSV